MVALARSRWRGPGRLRRRLVVFFVALDAFLAVDFLVALPVAFGAAFAVVFAAVAFAVVFAVVFAGVAFAGVSVAGVCAAAVLFAELGMLSLADSAALFAGAIRRHFLMGVGAFVFKADIDCAVIRQ